MHLRLLLLWAALGATTLGDDQRLVALRPLNGAPPPTISILSPAPGTNISSVDSEAIELQLALDVAFWCTGAENEEECAPLGELVVCIDATTVEGRHLSRQGCAPVTSADALAPMAGHLPVGAFDLTARLVRVDSAAGLGGPVRLVSTSRPVRLHRAAAWGAAQAAALEALLPLEGGHQRRGAGARLARWRHGVLLFNVNDLPAGVSLETQGEWEESVVRLLASGLRPGDLAVDVGAHLGSMAVPLARRVGRAGRVLALEPQQDLFRALSANLALNGLAQVEALHAAASDRGGGRRSIPVRDPAASGRSNFGAYSLLDAAGDSILVGSLSPAGGGAAEGSPTAAAPTAPTATAPLTTTTTTTATSSFPIVALDDLELLAARCPALVKVDVEGLEEAVVRGARAILARCAPALFLENQCASRSPGLVALLVEVGYACWWDPAPYFSPDNYLGLRPGSDGGTGNPGVSLNMLCLPEAVPGQAGAEAAARVRGQRLSLADVLAELDRVDPARPLVESYAPVQARRDSGLPPPFELSVKMADC